MREVDKLIKKYGQNVYLSCKNWRSKDYRAVIMPLRYKNKMYLRSHYNDMGRYNNDYFVYIGPADINFSTLPSNTTVHLGKTELTVQKWEGIYFEGKLLYIWAVLKED